jgi:prepilin-type processing-associated H-X9-DG protein
MRGVFRGPEHQWTNFGTIADGTSNTIAFSEAVTYTSMTGSHLKGNIAVLGPGNTNNNADFVNNRWTIIDQCFAAIDPNNRNLITNQAEERYNCRGWDWCGAPPHNLFNTVLPPNSPSCAENTQPKYGQVLMSATSHHTGGVNVSMADGSVHFVSDTIDYGNNSSRVNGVKSGPSSFGVWGAMGSAEGGEATTSL